jgi:putative ABC transport system permease protein
MEISRLGLILGLLLLVIPLYIIYAFKLNILPKALTGITKMLIYLCLTGFFLKYIFEWNSIFINILWMIVMALAASFTTIIKARLNVRKFIIPVGVGIFLTAIIIGLFFIFLVAGQKNPFDARFFIPITGLLIGGMVETNYKALSTYYMGLKHHNQLYYYLLGNGATHNEAVNYFVRRALEKVSIDSIANMAAIVVGLSPIMMWAMLLSGMSVVAAVEYQVLIIIVTFCAPMISVVMTLWAARKYSFDEYDRLKNVSKTVDVNQSV